MSRSRSVAWSLGGQIATTAASMASTVVLARLLTPTDFGVFAFAATIYAVVQWLLQMGMGQYVLREAELSPEKLNGAFAASCAQGLIASVIVVALAPFAAWFGHMREIAFITLSVAIIPFLGSPESVCDALWLRQGRYGRVAMLQIAKAATQTIVSIACQYFFHWGPFALTAGLVVSMALTFVVSIYSLMVTNGAKPLMTRKQWAVLRSYGGRSFTITLAFVFSQRIPELLIGRVLNVAMLGYYNRAGAAIDTVTRTLSSSIVRAAAPQLFKSVNEGDPLGDAVARFLNLVLFFVWPATAGVAILAMPIIRLLYGPQWEIAGQVLPLLCLIFAIDSARTGYSETLIIRDRLGLHAWIEGAHAVIAIVFVFAAARYGLIAILWARAVEAFLCNLLYWFFMRRLGGFPLDQVGRIFLTNALLAASAVAAPYALMAHWGWPGKLDAIGFALPIGSGIVCWLGALAVLRHPFLAKGIGILRNKIRLPGGAAMPEYSGLP